MQKGLPRLNVRRVAIYDDSIKVEDHAGKHSRFPMNLGLRVVVGLIRAMTVERADN